jgi:hypothetical protein
MEQTHEGLGEEARKAQKKETLRQTCMRMKIISEIIGDVHKACNDAGIDLQKESTDIAKCVVNMFQAIKVMGHLIEHGI